jgi:hypothetical protein
VKFNKAYKFRLYPTKKQREDSIRHGKQRFKFGVYCAWAVRPIELKE